MIALVGVGDELVDFAVRYLGKNAVAFADGQQDRIQHGVDAAHDLRISALELLRLAAIAELPLLRGFDQAPHFFLQGLQDGGHVVDGHFHLFVIAFVDLADQLVDLARGNLGQNAVAFADGQQDRVQHFVDALNHLAMNAVEQGCLAALGEAAFLGRVHQAHDLIQHQRRIVFNDSFGGAGTILNPMSVSAMTVPGALRLPVFTYHCCRHETRSSLGWTALSPIRSSVGRQMRCGSSSETSRLNRYLTGTDVFRPSTDESSDGIQGRAAFLPRAAAAGRPRERCSVARTASCASRSGSRISATVPLPRMVAPETTWTCR